MSDPLIHPSPNQETIDTNPALDPKITSEEQRQELEANFDKWLPSGDEDSEPAAPSDEPKKETVKTEPRADRKPAKEAPPVQDDVDLDSIEPPRNASASTQSQFKALKTIAKRFGTESKTFRNKLSSYLQEEGLELPDDPEKLAETLEAFGSKLQTYKKSQITPEVQRELETNRQILRAQGIMDDPEFVQQYTAPRQRAYSEFLMDIARFLPGTKEEVAQDFVTPLWNEYRPSNPALTGQWLDEQLGFCRGLSEQDRHRIRAEFDQAQRLDKAEIAKHTELAANGPSYQKWMNDEQQKRQTAWEAEVHDETFKFLEEKHPDWIPDVKNPESPRGKDLNDRFRKLMMAADNPRTRARLCAEHLEMQEELNSKDFKKWREQKTKLQAEVTTRRKIADVPMKSGLGGAKSKPAGEKELPKDARKSLSRAFAEWET